MRQRKKMRKIIRNQMFSPMCEKSELVGYRPPHHLDRPYYIKESATPSFIEKKEKTKEGKVKFVAALQTAGDLNRNKRIYPKDVLQDSIDRLQEVLEKRQLIGELDHPISDNPVRQTTVLFKEASHVFTKLWFEGDVLFGEMETLPYTPGGRILSGLIMDDISVGWSLRGMADLSTSPDGKGQIVEKPLVTISYDAVSNPSHSKAVVREVYQENVKLLNESNAILVCNNGICYLAPRQEDITEQKIVREDIGELLEQEIQKIHKRYTSY